MSNLLIVKIFNNYFEYLTIFIRNTLNNRSYMLLVFFLTILFSILLIVLYNVYNYIKQMLLYYN